MSDDDIWKKIGPIASIIGIIVAIIIGCCRKYLLRKCGKLCGCCPCVKEEKKARVSFRFVDRGGQRCYIEIPPENSDVPVQRKQDEIPPEVNDVTLQIEQDAPAEINDVPVQIGEEDVIIRGYLLSRQQKLCCKANLFTPAIMNKKYQVDIADMFTNLDLVKVNKIEQDAKPTSLEEILDIVKSTHACKVLIEGEGGIGKSTLLRYLAYNWASKPSDETFKGKIVFLFNIRDIDKGKTILDAILKQIDLEDFTLTTYLPEDIKLIKRFILNHADEIVLLMDGLDELRNGSESPISFFQKKKMDNSKVILTSRSGNIDEFIKVSSVHVKVNGFNADNIKKYIKAHFDYCGLPALRDSLINALYEDIHLELCKNPMMLLLICIMWQERQDLPTDIADLYKEVFRCILNQFNKQEANYLKISNFEDIPENYVNAMLVLGKCMYEGLKVNQLYINKKHLEGNEEIVTLALKLGFVYKDAPGLTEFGEIFTAPHKLIVESLVGFYLYKLCQTAELENECAKAMDKLVKPLNDNEWEIIIENEHLIMAKLFAIGFLGADAGTFLNHWITNSVSTYRSLMRHCEFVKKKYRVAVERELVDHMTKKDLEIGTHINNISNSLSRFIHHINPSLVNEGDHFIKLMRIMYVNSELINYTGVKTFIESLSSKEKGRMLVHLLFALKVRVTFFHEIGEVCTGDDVQYFRDELQKLNFTFHDIVTLVPCMIFASSRVIANSGVVYCTPANT